MSTKWNTQVVGRGTPNFGDLLKDEFTVILLQGKNTFGDMIYCYVKVTFPNLEKLKSTLNSSEITFNPSDFGTVVAAGKGEPSQEVRAEIAITYPMLSSASGSSSNTSGSSSQPPPVEKKAWDEY